MNYDRRPVISVVSAKDPESIRFELRLYCLFNDTQRDLLFNVIMGICRRAGCEYREDDASQYNDRALKQNGTEAL